MMSCLLSTLSLLLAPVTHRSAGTFDVVVSSQQAFAVLAPIRLGKAKFSQAVWTPDGDRLLLAEHPVLDSKKDGPLTLVGWDRASQNARPLWITENPTAAVNQVSWLPSTSSALVCMTWKEFDPSGEAFDVYGVLYLDAASGDSHWVPGLASLTVPPLIQSSPVQGQALITFADRLLTEGQMSDPEAYLPGPESYVRSSCHFAGGLREQLFDGSVER